MSQSERAAARDLCDLVQGALARASEGPFAVGVLGENPADIFREATSRGTGDVWCVFLPSQSAATAETPGHAVTVCYTGNGPTSEANADLIAMLGNEIPRLATELRRALTREENLAALLEESREPEGPGARRKP